MTKPDYRPRLIDTMIHQHLQTFGAVCAEGPKWCGKTWTSLHHANSVIYIGSPENHFQNRALAEMSPDLVLTGEVPRLLDEWQEVPSLWDAVRHSVDQQTEKGQFILTGSATPNHKGVLHSGAGRISRLKMRTMSLVESGHTTGQVSLRALFDEPLQPYVTELVSLDRWIELTIRGGWPGSIDLDFLQARTVPGAYLQTLIEDDMNRVDGVSRNRRKVEMLLKSLARNESTIATNRTINKDIDDEEDSVGLRTIVEYLDVLDRLFLLENQPAFNPNLRSSVRVGKSPKRHFVDPSLAVAAMGATPDMLRNDLRTFGFLFEALVERDLRTYAETWGGKLFHYRDASDREIDAVVELPDGRWGAFEIKLGGNQVDQAAEKLVALKKWMEADPQARPPAILGVICGIQNVAMTRPDGVLVIPASTLCP
ncbi:MAG: ATP-binding protein [Clostridiaceae bacterium]|nr:ATP-binding protein [Clostridiaceae bacterium]